MKTTLIAALALAATSAIAAPATVTFLDVTGDTTAVGDISSLTLNFDTSTGAYTAIWTATGANPFQGNLNFNANLGNQRLGVFSTFASSASSLSPSTIFSYSGTSSALAQWLIGDTIVTFGSNPPYSTSFESGIVNLDNSPDRDRVFASAVVTTPGAAVPDSATTLALLAPACLGLIALRRRQTA